MENSFRNHSIHHLRNFSADKEKFDYSDYSILYSAQSEIILYLQEKEVIVAPETFFFIPPGVVYDIREKYKNAFIFTFKKELFIDRLELMYQVTNGYLFKNKDGLAIKNEFLPYEQIIKYYYLPVRKHGVNKLIRKNNLINFIEFILIRIFLSKDPKIEEHSKNTHEKQLIERFLFIIKEQQQFNFNMNYYADQLNVTKRTLDNAMQAVFKTTTKRYVVNKALEQAKTMLEGSDLPIKNISMELGFSQESNFNNFFKKHTGLTPRQFRLSSIENDSLNYIQLKS